ncbi:hypothetical protein OG874_00660 [Nocardia sp. NBC_00565]|uniref:hypothetical protein n=1 Tax=Nocardia sp. NBC_00565 TaxID=2975993 RepID=UPI002E80DE01|nr:hypothetical protein [Nocardia sp. NBC_00565]WUC03767.1 hypothetical protein OG874_00660 [Nocardia sp. NBC_00565]
MEIKQGDRVYLVAGGVHVFEVLEIGAAGDPDQALVQAVGEERPGIYPFATPIRYLVPATEAAS